MRYRLQIFALALLCGSLAAFSAYWMRGELVKQGLFVTEPRHIACANESVAQQIAAELRSDPFRQSLCTEEFKPEDLEINAVADGKWVEAKLTLHCWGRASYSLAKFTREFDPSDPAAQKRNQRQLAAYDSKMKEIADKALIGF